MAIRAPDGAKKYQYWFQKIWFLKESQSRPQKFSLEKSLNANIFNPYIIPTTQQKSDQGDCGEGTAQH